MNVVNDLKSRIERIAYDYGYEISKFNDIEIILYDDYECEITLEIDFDNYLEYVITKYAKDDFWSILSLEGNDIEMCHKILEVLKDEE